tara:strand:+ start:570 stop:911 length:342 start_codon:yes stop_codon:yes gene_type:complete
MDIGDRDSRKREIASIGNMFVVERFGILHAGTDYPQLDVDGPTELSETPSFSEARRIWRRWVKEKTCGTARIYRMRYFYSLHDCIGEHKIGLNDTGESADWIDVADENEYLEL